MRQPWVVEINDGIKTLEFRSWQASHRGPLLIYASSYAPGFWMTVDALDEKGQSIEEALPLPTGCAMCVVDLKHIRPMTRSIKAS